MTLVMITPFDNCGKVVLTPQNTIDSECDYTVGNIWCWYFLESLAIEIAKQMIRMLYLSVCHKTFASPPYQSPTDEVYGV